MITLYGIPNCDTVKKARNWLSGQGVDYRFHNFKTEGVTAGQVRSWCDSVGIDTVLNRRGTTWRKLDAAQTASLDENGLIALMVEHPSLIKRPVVENGQEIMVGFSPERYTSLL